MAYPVLRGGSVVALLLISICVFSSTASYLHPPRVHFAGEFFADASTINNFLTNYKLDEEIIEDWNPKGTAEWTFVNCIVTAVTLTDGTTPENDPLIGKPIVNNVDLAPAKFVDIDPEYQTDTMVYGLKFGVNWAQDDNKNGFMSDWIPSVITQNFWLQMHKDYSQSPHAREQQGGTRSTTRLSNISWSETLTSPALRQLKNAADETGYLSVGISLHMYAAWITDKPNHRYGSVVGTIGVGNENEALNFGGDRLMKYPELEEPPPLWLSESNICYDMIYPWMNTAPFTVDRDSRRVSVDFGSAFQLDIHGNQCDMGPLYLGIEVTGIATTVAIVDQLNYLSVEWHETAGIQDFELTHQQWIMSTASKFVVVRIVMNEDENDQEHNYPVCQDAQTSQTSCVRILLQELEYYIRPFGEYVFRLEADQSATLEMLITKFGRPASDVQVELRQYLEGVRAGLAYSNTATTNESGIASITFTAEKIGEPRAVYDIDGQIFAFEYCSQGICSNPGETFNAIAVLVWSYVDNEGPIFWDDHIQPIFLQYERLYPVMSYILKLGDYNSVLLPQNIRLLVSSMSLPFNHPSFMPVTRDLSPTKRNMIVKWLGSKYHYRNWSHVDELLFTSPDFCQQKVYKGSKNSAPEVMLDPEEVDDILGKRKYSEYFVNLAELLQDSNIPEWLSHYSRNTCTMKSLKQDLQNAFLLEFYTIPPYLTAMYSIKDGYNQEVYSIIRSVVMQEMIHVAQVANLLIALGETPIIDSKETAPSYPATGLPGGVLPRLTVTLQKASPRYIHDVFMAIEYPHQLDGETSSKLTIGKFYDHISKCIERLDRRHGNIFCQDIDLEECKRPQIHWPWPIYDRPGRLHKVTNLETAQAAINVIVEQGEGASPQDPTYLDSDKIAHFYKFAELACKRHMDVYHDHTYDYKGRAIEFESEGVWPMRDNPSKECLKPDTQLYRFAKTFHRHYRAMLRKLQELVSGNPSAITGAVYLMENMQIHAKRLMELEYTSSDVIDECKLPSNQPTQTCGPIFDYEWDD